MSGEMAGAGRPDPSDPKGKQPEDDFGAGIDLPGATTPPGVGSDGATSGTEGASPSGDPASAPTGPPAAPTGPRIVRAVEVKFRIQDQLDNLPEVSDEMKRSFEVVAQGSADILNSLPSTGVMADADSTKWSKFALDLSKDTELPGEVQKTLFELSRNLDAARSDERILEQVRERCQALLDVSSDPGLQLPPTLPTPSATSPSPASASSTPALTPVIPIARDTFTSVVTAALGSGGTVDSARETLDLADVAQLVGALISDPNDRAVMYRLAQRLEQLNLEMGAKHPGSEAAAAIDSIHSLAGADLIAGGGIAPEQTRSLVELKDSIDTALRSVKVAASDANLIELALTEHHADLTRTFGPMAGSVVSEITAGVTDGALYVRQSFTNPKGARFVIDLSPRQTGTLAELLDDVLVLNNRATISESLFTDGGAIASLQESSLLRHVTNRFNGTRVVELSNLSIDGGQEGGNWVHADLTGVQISNCRLAHLWLRHCAGLSIQDSKVFECNFDGPDALERSSWGPNVQVEECIFTNNCNMRDSYIGGSAKFTKCTITADLDGAYIDRPPAKTGLFSRGFEPQFVSCSFAGSLTTPRTFFAGLECNPAAVNSKTLRDALTVHLDKSSHWDAYKKRPEVLQLAANGFRDDQLNAVFGTKSSKKDELKQARRNVLEEELDKLKIKLDPKLVQRDVAQADQLFRGVFLPQESTGGAHTPYREVVFFHRDHPERQGRIILFGQQLMVVDEDAVNNDVRRHTEKLAKLREQGEQVRQQAANGALSAPERLQQEQALARQRAALGDKQVLTAEEIKKRLAMEVVAGLKTSEFFVQAPIPQEGNKPLKISTPGRWTQADIEARPWTVVMLEEFYERFGKDSLGYIKEGSQSA